MVLGWKCAGEGLDRQFRCAGMCPWWLQLRDAAHCTVGMGMWGRGDGDEGMRVQEWGCCAIIPGVDREICCVFGKFRGGETALYSERLLAEGPRSAPAWRRKCLWNLR